jgi:lysophospholipase L1-like esterase
VTLPSTDFAWRTAPELPTVRSRWTAVHIPGGLVTWGSRVLAVAIAAIWPVRYFDSLFFPADRKPAIVAIMAVAGLAAQLVADRRWAVRLAIWVAGGVAADIADMGEVYGALTVALFALGDWAANGRPPLPGLPRAAKAQVGTSVLMWIAARQVWADPWDRRSLVTIALAAAFTAVSRWLVPVVERAARAAAKLLAEALSLIVFFVVGLLVVALPWLAQRIFFLDPVAERSRPGWAARHRGDVRAARLWTIDATEPKRGVLRRIRWFVALPLTVLVLVVLLARIDRDRSIGQSGPSDDAAPAVAGLSWWGDYLDEMDWAINRTGGATSADGYPPMHDVHGRYFNVNGGFRTSWRPPACTCRRLRVWLYGGSTMLGIGQRDDHTIPSELARVAWEHGIALEVSNRGVAGELNWQETQRMQWDVAAEGAPDLVVFYDGFNDLSGAARRNNDPTRGYSPAWPVPGRAYSAPPGDDNALLRRIFGRAPDGAGRNPTVVPPKLAPSALGDAAMTAFQRGREPARRLMRADGVPIQWFWQPDRLTRPARADEPQGDRDEERDLRTTWAAARKALPADVHDLGGLFDRERRPVYFDSAHTNEYGARRVAEAMFETLRPQLDELADASRSGG